MRIFLQKMFVFTAREVMAPANTVRRGFFMALDKEMTYLVKREYIVLETILELKGHDMM